MNIRETAPRISELEKISTRTDTRDYLAKAAGTTEKLKDWLVVDVDAHVNETSFWSEVTERIDNDVLRYIAQAFRERTGAPPGLINLNGPLFQDVAGRIMHQQALAEQTPPGLHRQVQLCQRAMDAMGIDYMVVFPTPMLSLGMHPQADAEVALGNAYNRWLIDRILSADDRIKSLIYLPFNTPQEAERTVKALGDKKGVIGFCVTSTRNKPVHHNDYMRLYSMIEQTGKPLAFHAGYHWQDPSLATVNRFLGMHALGFAWCNMVHMTNWVLNGIPERFPKLKSLWVESGLAWVPFLMQRLDDQYLMRPSEAPQLKRLPSEYMNHNCFYTTQPMETTHPKALENTFEMIKAETQLMFSSDWPHYDFDLPQEICDLPFLSEPAKRNILGLNAARIFNLDPTPVKKLIAA